MATYNHWIPCWLSHLSSHCEQWLPCTLPSERWGPVREQNITPIVTWVSNTRQSDSWLKTAQLKRRCVCRCVIVGSWFHNSQIFQSVFEWNVFLRGKTKKVRQREYHVTTGGKIRDLGHFNCGSVAGLRSCKWVRCRAVVRPARGSQGKPMEQSPSTGSPLRQLRGYSILFSHCYELIAHSRCGGGSRMWENESGNESSWFSDTDAERFPRSRLLLLQAQMPSIRFTGWGQIQRRSGSFQRLSERGAFAPHAQTCVSVRQHCPSVWRMEIHLDLRGVSRMSVCIVFCFNANAGQNAVFCLAPCRCNCMRRHTWSSVSGCESVVMPGVFFWESIVPRYQWRLCAHRGRRMDELSTEMENGAFYEDINTLFFFSIIKPMRWKDSRQSF